MNQKTSVVIFPESLYLDESLIADLNCLAIVLANYGLSRERAEAALFEWANGRYFKMEYRFLPPSKVRAVAAAVQQALNTFDDCREANPAAIQKQSAVVSAAFGETDLSNYSPEQFAALYDDALDILSGQDVTRRSL